MAGQGWERPGGERERARWQQLPCHPPTHRIALSPAPALHSPNPNTLPLLAGLLRTGRRTWRRAPTTSRALLRVRRHPLLLCARGACIRLQRGSGRAPRKAAAFAADPGSLTRGPAPPPARPATAAGYQADMRFKETQQYLRPLYARLRNRSLDPSLLAGLAMIVERCKERNYLAAYEVSSRMPGSACMRDTDLASAPLSTLWGRGPGSDGGRSQLWGRAAGLPPPSLHSHRALGVSSLPHASTLEPATPAPTTPPHAAARPRQVYMGVSVGNAAWPIGVTQVGLHERSAREKIRLGAGSAVVRAPRRCSTLAALVDCTMAGEEQRRACLCSGSGSAVCCLCWLAAHASTLLSTPQPALNPSLPSSLPCPPAGTHHER